MYGRTSGGERCPPNLARGAWLGVGVDSPTGLRVVLSTDGKHTVLVDITSEEFADDEVLRAKVARACAVFGELLNQYGWQQGRQPRSSPSGDKPPGVPSEGGEAGTPPQMGAPRCEDCGREIRGFVARDGTTITAEQMVASSRRRFGGHLYCGQCRKRYA